MSVREKVRSHDERNGENTKIPHRVMCKLVSTGLYCACLPADIVLLKEEQKEAFLFKKENSTFSGLACQTSHGNSSNNSKPFTNNRGYDQRLGLEGCKWHNTSANAPLNRDEGGLLSNTFLHLITRRHGS